MGTPQAAESNPTAIVIFGASGDLKHRKLMPALYNLAYGRLLPGRFAVIGVARSEKSDASFRAELREAVSSFSRRKPLDAAVWAEFEKGVSYVRGAVSDAATFQTLREHLERAAADSTDGQNRLFYLAVPPAEFGPIVEG